MVLTTRIAGRSPWTSIRRTRSAAALATVSRSRGRLALWPEVAVPARARRWGFELIPKLRGDLRRDRLESNLEAMSVRLSSADFETLGALAEPPERHWSERRALRWA